MLGHPTRMCVVKLACTSASPLVPRCVLLIIQGKTALHIAVLNGHLAAVNLLIAAGADLNARDEVRGNYIIAI